MARRIFINYRRSQSLQTALYLQERLASVCGRKNVFLDVRQLEGGSRWDQEIRNRIEQSDVMVVLIGADWLDARNPDGSRRIENSDDYVRLEIKEAIRLDIPLLPVLIDDAKMPAENDLPTDLRALASTHALSFRLTSVDSDLQPIISTIRRLRRVIAGGVPKWLVAFLLAFAVVAGGASTLWSALKVNYVLMRSDAVTMAEHTQRINAIRNEIEQAREREKELLMEASKELEQSKRELAEVREGGLIQLSAGEPYGVWNASWNHQSPSWLVEKNPLVENQIERNPCAMGVEIKLTQYLGDVGVWEAKIGVHGRDGFALANGELYLRFPPVARRDFVTSLAGNVFSENAEVMVTLRDQVVCRGKATISRSEKKK